MDAALVGLVGTLLGTVLGSVLTLWPQRNTRKRRLKTHWSAILAEMRLCDESVEYLLNDKIPAPLYRLPVNAYRFSYPVLLADGDVSEDDVLTLGRYFGWVEDINRGLDAAAEANLKKDWDAVTAAHNRNCLKAEDLRRKYTGPALDVVDSKISNPSVHALWARHTRRGRKPVVTVKIILAVFVVVGVVLGGLSIPYEPHGLLLESSPTRPWFLSSWLVWSVASISAVGYVLIDFIRRK